MGPDPAPPAERLQAELIKRLRDEHATLITILDSLDACVYVADMETYELLFVNAYVRNAFGNIGGRTCWQTLQVGQTGPCAFCTNDRLLDAHGQATGVYVWEHFNALAGRWFECRDSAIRWVDGRTVRLEIATDVTARHEALAQVHESQQRLHAITSTLGEGVFVLDTLGRTTFVNPKTVELLGWSEQELLGRDLHEMVHMIQPNGVIVPAEACQVTEVARTGLPASSKEELYLRKDGSHLPVAWVATPLLTDGEIRGVVVAFHDITARKTAEAKQSQLIAELREALATVKTLRGLLPMCAWCRKIRNDQGYWQQVEEYLQDNADVSVTHGMCDACAEQLLPPREDSEDKPAS